MASDVLIVGSIGFDDIETDVSTVTGVIGGSASFAGMAASFITYDSAKKVSLVSRVGNDFGVERELIFEQAGIDLSNVERLAGESFRWSARYSTSLATAETLSTSYNVFEGFVPNLDKSELSPRILLCANCAPQIQVAMLESIAGVELVALDSMAKWISSDIDLLSDALRLIDILFLNEQEIRLLAGTPNLTKAVALVRSGEALVGGLNAGRGPGVVIVKRGDLGAIAFTSSGIISLPGYPTGKLVDPTGCGDSFAGALLARLVRREPVNIQIDDLRDAMVYAIVFSSFTIESHGAESLARLDRAAFHARLDGYRRIVGI
jgi:hypothetical protein